MNINLSGDVNSDMHKELSDFLQMYAYDKPLNLCITLNSEGGSATDALAIATLIRKSSHTIKIHATGSVQSAATMILAAGAKGHRTMDSTAWVMIHEEQIELSGSVSDVLHQAKDFKRLEEQWCMLLQRYTGHLASKWESMHRVETYLNAAECLKVGLIDKIEEIP